MLKKDITDDILESLLNEPDFIPTSFEEIKTCRGEEISFFDNFNFTGYTEEAKYHKWEDFERKYNGLIEVNVTGPELAYISDSENNRTIIPSGLKTFAK